jgi:hypothetical protein
VGIHGSIGPTLKRVHSWDLSGLILVELPVLMSVEGLHEHLLVCFTDESLLNVLALDFLGGEGLPLLIQLDVLLV